MFSNYLKSAMRNLLKYKLYNGINLAGLSVGLAACIMIMIFVSHELSYDKWIPERDRVFKSGATLNFQGAPEAVTDGIPNVVPALLRGQVDALELSARLAGQTVALANDTFAYEQRVTLTDPDVFEIFGITLIEGDPTTALNAPDTIVLNQTDARRVFGDTPALGETLKVNGGELLRVTGVMSDWPEASDIELRALVPFSSPIIDDQPWLRENWGSFSGTTYVRIKEGYTVEQFTDAFNAQAKKVAPEWVYTIPEQEGTPPVMVFHFTPAEDAHLYTPGRIAADASEEALWSAVLVAVLILLIAVMNVTNLGTMLALKRVREVTIRKALGANVKQLVGQILIEAIVLAQLSVIVGLVWVELLLPTFGDIMDRPLTTEPVYQMQVLLPLVAISLLIGVISGLYPAIVAAKFRPADHLNGIAPTIGVRFRNALMIMQFAATIGLLGTCFVVFLQTQYAQSRNPGFDSNNLLQVRGIHRPVVNPKSQNLMDAFERIPGVQMVAASHVAVGDGYNNYDTGSIDGETIVNIRRMPVSYNFFETVGVKPLAGRVFSRDRQSDRVAVDATEGTLPAIANRIMVSQLGIDSPQDAIGRLVNRSPDQLPLEIVGVVENIQMDSVHTEIRPGFYIVRPEEYRHIIIRLASGDPTNVLSEVDRIWSEMFPEIPVQRSFTDEEFAEYYETERRRGWLLFGSAGLMIVISTVGLFALSALTTERRAREIVVRKVLGAKTNQIVRLLLWQFSKPILIANIIAWPIAWFVMQDWLEAFVDRIDLSPLPFAAASGLVLVIAGATIIGQVIIMSMSTPVHLLRNE